MTGADFNYSGITTGQIGSTSNAGAGNLSGIGLAGDNFSRANFSTINFSNSNLCHANLSNTILNSSTFTNANLSGANLSNANLNFATLTNANFSDADLRGAVCSSLAGATVHNTVLMNGTINSLSLGAGETLPIYNNRTTPIHVVGTPSFDPAASVQMVFDGNPWGSAISFDPGVLVSLAGNLDLTVAPGVNEASLVGDTFKLFDWTGVTPTGQFNIVADPGSPGIPRSFIQPGRSPC